MFFSRNFGVLHTSTFPEVRPSNVWMVPPITRPQILSCCSCAAWDLPSRHQSLGYASSIWTVAGFWHTLQENSQITVKKKRDHKNMDDLLPEMVISIATLVCPISLMLQAPCYLGLQQDTPWIFRGKTRLQFQLQWAIGVLAMCHLLDECTIWLFNSSPWKITIFNSKPSINGHFPWLC